MALPNNPPISMRQIYDEFQVPYGTSFKQLYRGGPYVPNIAQNANISTDPNQLKMSQFYGAVRYIPMNVTANPTSADGQVFQNEPAPNQRTVNASTMIGVTGGTGSYTYSTAHLSGDVFSVFNGNTANPAWSANVFKGGTRSAVYRCTVSDGVGSAFVDVPVNLSYFTDL